MPERTIPQQLYKPKLFITIIIFVATACSWQDHLNRYANKSPQRKYDVMRESLVTRDSILLDSTACARIRYYSPQDTILHTQVLNCENGFQMDSSYWNDGSVCWARTWYRNPPSEKQGYILTRFFDKQGRPLWQTFYQNRAEGDREYKQFYTEEGNLLPEKHPVYYYELEAN